MARKYTQIPSDSFKELIKNAGILLKGKNAFSPSSATVQASSIFAATSGGISFADAVTYSDFGDDIDNCPKNTKELKEIESREITLSGTLVTVDEDVAKFLIGAADKSTATNGLITPRDVIDVDNDFEDIWFVTDYSNVDGGFVAIHLMNCLSTGGFQLQSSDKAKGQFAFTFTAHYSMANESDVGVVPYEIYIKAGTADEATADEAEEE